MVKTIGKIKTRREESQNLGMRIEKLEYKIKKEMVKTTEKWEREQRIDTKSGNEHREAGIENHKGDGKDNGVNEKEDRGITKTGSENREAGIEIGKWQRETLKRNDKSQRRW